LRIPSFGIDVGRPAASAPIGRPMRMAVKPWSPPPIPWARLGYRAVVGVGLALLALAVGLLAIRVSNADRVYPAVFVADMPVGGETYDDASAAVEQRAAALAASKVAFTHDGKTWQAPLSQLGLTVDATGSVERAFAVGREPDALARLQTTLGLARQDKQIPLTVQFDERKLNAWFDDIDRQLGLPAHNASLKIDGASVSIVPELDGTVVDRPAATAEIIGALRGLSPFTGLLPTTARTARVRAVDLAGAQANLAQALANPVQVTFRSGLWTLPPADLGKFVRQNVDPNRTGAAAFSLSLDRPALTKYLDGLLAAGINRDPKNAQVGWNGEHLVSVVQSQDGVQLQSDKLAALVEQSFFGQHGPVEAPAIITQPTVDSNNLDKLGITTLLGTGSSNYAGSIDGRATNIEVAANLLNGTLVPPHSTFSFLNSIGVINEEKGFVTAQVISGESIGKDIGGGVCQVSTTVFRAAYLAGLPITEWWPHRFRIPFYELDGWEPGLDASILQPTEDPSTWADFKFENPSDKWMLVESWADGARVVVNIYGTDLGYKVESDGPKYGAKFQMLPDEEVVDSSLDPGTINQTMSAGIGQEVSWYRRVFDKNGNLLWERQFYTKYYPKGNVWTVSPDMKGDSPANPDRALPPLPQDPPDGSTGTDG
jgi:vancomycin resistance protein YoaR